VSWSSDTLYSARKISVIITTQGKKKRSSDTEILEEIGQYGALKIDANSSGLSGLQFNQWPSLQDSDVGYRNLERGILEFRKIAAKVLADVRGRILGRVVDM
jgi:hypothetical protein